MKPFHTIHALVAPLDRPNIDTDQIIPKQFLKRIERTGYGDFLFYDWRRIQDGPNAGSPDPEFVLNQPRYQGAQILITDRNFGCGSSREHAAWALADYGFRAVIASSFADIFHTNAGKNGIVTVTLPEDQVRTLMEKTKSTPGYKLTVSLEEQKVFDESGFSTGFTIDPFRRECLLGGLDDIDLTLRHKAELDAFEQQHDRKFWFLPRPQSAAALAAKEGTAQ